MRISELLLTALMLPVAAGAASTIKLATLAPEGSNWTKVLRAIDADVREQTDDHVGFKIYTGGVQGDEKTMLRKIGVGQLHAGAFGGLGTSQIVPDLLALELPFLFSDYGEIDYVLDKTYPYYESAYDDAGFILLGWADIGFVHILSKRPVRGLYDIRRMKVWRLEGEPITEVLFRKANVSSVPLIIPDVLLGLQTNLIEVVYSPPAAAIVLQWFTRAKYLAELPINYTLGALLIAKKRFSLLPPEHQKILRDVCRHHMQAQIRQSRADNDEAFKVLTNEGLEIVGPDSSQVRIFQELVEESIPELVGSTISTEAYELVKMHLAAYRARHAAPQP